MEMQSSVKHLPAPPSPTLTNPDMILPYTVYPPNPTPSPPLQAIRPYSPPGAIELLIRNSEVVTQDRGSVTPRTTPPLGSYGSGTMLPDIEEVETTPKGGLSRKSSSGSRSPPLRWSPRSANSRGDGRHPVERLAKRLSYGSVSEVSEDFDFGRWDGFDGAASVDGESVFQDEEDNGSVSGQAVNGTTEHRNGTQRGENALDGDNEDPYSHAALSRRAERILANAKKRLTHMEGNLSRARHSLMQTPTSSISSTSSRSPDLTQRDNPLSSETNGWNISPTKHRQLHSPLSSLSTSPGHSRVFSETSVPSSLHTSPQSRDDSEDLRASSAMGSVGMTPRFRDQYGHKSLQATDRSRSDNLPRNASLSRRHNNTLQPLDEEESAPVSFSPAEEIVSDPGQRLDQETSDGSTFGSQFPTNNTLTRSRSSLQMRDLRDQMQDLKGKISTLKERARKDNMRRRSLQSLRMPSPFTAAQQWQNGAEAYGDGDLSADTRDALAELHSPVGHFGTHEERELLTAEESVYSCEQDEAVAGIKRGSDYPDSIAQSQYEDAEEDFEMEDAMLFNDDDGSINHRPPRDDSLRLHQDSRRANADHEEESISGDQEFYESSPSPMGERHEDREDAFDYEHFFLHSGMGNYSRANSRRRNSYDSTDSGETTKAPTPPTGATRERQTNGKSQKDNHASVNDYASQGRHQRNNSVDSVSTFATFATATEGGGSDGGSDENGEEWEHQQHKYPMAGTWLPDYFSQSNATAANRDVNRPELSSNSSQTHIRSDTALRINGHLTPGSPTGSSTPSTTRSFPLVNKSKHLTPLPSPQPTSSLTSALTASVTSPPMQMSKGDRDLVEKLVESLGKVCVHLHPDGDGNKYEGRVWRRRLDTARRILNGEIDEDGLQ